MNRRESDILSCIADGTFSNQRSLAQASGYSLGAVNQTLRSLEEKGYLKPAGEATELARTFLEQAHPQNAVILAAGFGMRMAPINTEAPKGLLEVNGEPLIERTIRQLREAGVQKICVVVGFLKEMYEYLIDEYDVELVVAADYAAKNNLHSLNCASRFLKNCYIVPCDIWCEKSPYHATEPYSWYMVSDEVDDSSTVRVNRKRELVPVAAGKGGNTMIGIAYFTQEDGRLLAERVSALCKDARYDHSFWESAIFGKAGLEVQSCVVGADKVVEINTYEQLRELDKNSKQLKTKAISIAAQALGVDTDEIQQIEMLKKGMTNRSFLFEAKGCRYIMRIPGEGTDQLIDRAQEAQVYQTIASEKLSDDVLYMNPENGYKITRYLNHARNCDPNNVQDLEKCMAKLRAFHGKRLKVDHTFDIYGKIDFYESLWQGRPSVYRDYAVTKANVKTLRAYIDATAGEKCLTHIDAVPDNFLFAQDENGNEEVRLIDWEYAGMQDPYVDIAMFCIYALYDREQVDRLIDIYFEGSCEESVRTRIYCYIAACGLLWSNWCEYKRNLGVEFGEYSLKQYRFAKDYFRIAQKRIEGEQY